MKTTITWFVDNPVAANLLMWIFIAGGVSSLFSIHKEEFPNIEPGIVQISIPYLGAAPEEVESGVCIRVEEAVEGVQGIDSMRSIATEGICTVIIELEENVDNTKALNEIKAKVQKQKNPLSR